MDSLDTPSAEEVAEPGPGWLTVGLSAALTLAGAAVYVVAAPVLDVATLWPWVGIGALGWLVALMLRAPVALAARRVAATTLGAQRIVVWVSGPAEELTRLVILLIATRDLPTALAIGIGWSLVEAVYAVPQPMLRSALRRRTDAQAREAREIMATMGLDRDVGPFWPGIERFFASGFHIGSTLLIAWQPWLVIGAVPLHSALNVSVLAILRRNLPLAMGALGAVGVAIFALGLAVWI